MSSEIPEPRVPEMDRDGRVALGSFRGTADPCYACSTCETVCPVVSTDGSFPGPKFQGPDQWRLRTTETEIDASIDACSNCLRCHTACPEDVSLATMHNVARAERLSGRSLSATYLRDRLLANYGRLARIGSKAPRLTNWLANNSWLRWVADRVLGITAERAAPRFAHQTFREWWTERGGAKVSSTDKRVAYFHGDHANYHSPGVGKSLVRVYEACGYEVAVPPQRCSGTPMFSNGFLEDAERAARFNVRTLAEYVERGYEVVATCPSCSLAIRETYPSLFDIQDVRTVADNTFDAVEYLLENGEITEGDVATDSLPDKVSYHAPCHARSQGSDGWFRSVFEATDGIDITNLGDECSGMGGTYGWKSERYETSMAIGKDLFESMEATPGKNAITECPTCAMQITHGTDCEISHPIELLAEGMGQNSSTLDSR